MANRPVAGDLFYNKTTDRPRVALRVGERDLLTTDDAVGGGPPTGAAGGDLGGTYPNPTVEALGTTGTAVNVGAAAPPSTGQSLVATSATTATWQTPSGAPSGAAGGDLGGTYPNPTVEALGTTGTAVTVGTAAPPTVGQVLTALTATTADWQTPNDISLNEYWCRDPSISYGSMTDEFTFASLDAAWEPRVWSTWTTPTLGGVVDSTAAPGASNYNLTPNARRSWLMVQPGTTLDLALRRSFTYVSATGFQFRMRITSSIIGDVSSQAATTAGISRLYLCLNNAGDPDVNSNVFVGYANDNPQVIRTGNTSAGLGTSVTYIGERNLDCEFIFIGFGTSPCTIDMYIRSPTGCRLLRREIKTIANGDTLWFVWRMTSSNSVHNIYAGDYFRELPDLRITP